jgi:hypothetical protein
VRYGVAQAVKAPRSTEHSNVEPETVEAKENSGDFSHVSPIGPSVIVVSGAAATRNVLLTGPSFVPKKSRLAA